MPLTVRRAILANVVTTLEGITVANGYSQTVQDVHRGLVAPEDQPTPFLTVVVADETYEEKAFPLISRSVRIEVVGEIECPQGAGDGPSDEAEKFLADVEKALLVDRSRGGNAVHTELVSNRLFDPEPGEPWVEFQLVVRVLYRTKRGDPYTKA